MTGECVYICDNCNAVFTCLKYYQEHRESHANLEGRFAFTCKHCEAIYSSENENLVHQKTTHKGEMLHGCDVCKQQSVSQEESIGLKRSIGTITDFHYRTMVLEEPSVSDLDLEDTTNENVDEEFGDIDGRNNVEEFVNINDSLSINHDMLSATGIPMTRHSASVTPSKRPLQENAPRPPRQTRSTVKGKGKGNRNSRASFGAGISGKFSCRHCGKTFKTRSHLQRHTLTHTGEKPYHCNRCDCRFNQSSSLRNHVIAIHTKEYPHKCDICGKGFLMPAVLRKHLSDRECGRATEQC